jgi:hypothetical protein
MLKRSKLQAKDMGARRKRLRPRGKIDYVCNNEETTTTKRVGIE